MTGRPAMPDLTARQRRELVRVIARAGTLTNRIQKRLDANGTDADERARLWARAVDLGVRAGELADAAGLHTGTVTKAVRALRESS